MESDGAMTDQLSDDQIAERLARELPDFMSVLDGELCIKGGSAHRAPIALWNILLAKERALQQARRERDQAEREVATLTDQLIALYKEATGHVGTIMTAREIIAAMRFIDVEIETEGGE